MVQARTVTSGRCADCKPTMNDPTDPHVILRMRETSLPFQGFAGGGRLSVRAVLVSGAIGDYTVYVGIGTSDWVRDYGNKVDFETACLLFAGLDRERYRP